MVFKSIHGIRQPEYLRELYLTTVVTYTTEWSLKMVTVTQYKCHYHYRSLLQLMTLRTDKDEPHCSLHRLNPSIDCLYFLLTEGAAVHLHLGDPAFEVPSITNLHSHSYIVLSG